MHALSLTSTSALRFQLYLTRKCTSLAGPSTDRYRTICSTKKENITANPSKQILASPSEIRGSKMELVVRHRIIASNYAKNWLHWMRLTLPSPTRQIFLLHNGRPMLGRRSTGKVFRHVRFQRRCRLKVARGAYHAAVDVLRSGRPVCPAAHLLLLPNIGLDLAVQLPVAGIGELALGTSSPLVCLVEVAPWQRNVGVCRVANP